MVDLDKQLTGAKSDAELLDILKSVTKFCKDYGYKTLEMRIDEKDCFYNVCVILYSGDGKKVISGFIPNPSEITIEDREKDLS